jgi:hypothetical protein
MLIGRLIADEQFRTNFLTDPAGTLAAIVDLGFELSHIEVAALVGTDPSVWTAAAERLDPRLQKASLKN